MLRPHRLLCHEVKRHASNASNRSLDYCMNIVKTRSYEHYLSTLLLPPKIRRFGFALRAFNSEIASIRDVVTSKHAGFGRLVFWRETVENLFDPVKPVPNHPIAKELKIAASQVNCAR